MDRTQPLVGTTDGDPYIGTFVKLPRREIVDAAALAGFDFVVCDMEHGQVSEREACDVIVAGAASGLPVVVRVPGIEPGLINRLLEWGADGIQVPHIASVDAAAAARAATRYPPEGSRSASLAQPAARYGTVRASDYLRAANERVTFIGQLETMSYADDLHDIVAQVDVAFVGVFDLSIDAGHPGRSDQDQVAHTVRQIEAAASSIDKPLGTFASSAEACAAAIRAGYSYIACSSDLAMLASSMGDAWDEISQFLPRRASS